MAGVIHPGNARESPSTAVPAASRCVRIIQPRLIDGFVAAVWLVVQVAETLFRATDEQQVAIGQRDCVQHAAVAEHRLHLPFAKGVCAGLCGAAHIQADAEAEIRTGLEKGCLVASSKDHKPQSDVAVRVGNWLLKEHLDG